jgi:hypothetical protein
MTQTIADLAQTFGGPQLSTDQLTLLRTMQAEPPMLLDTSLGGSGGYGQLNFLDNMGPGSEVPLQFQSTPANCRVFYIADDVADVTTTWARIAGGNYTCVDGGNPAVSPPGAAPKKSGGNGVHASVKVAGSVCAAILSAVFLMI